MRFLINMNIQTVHKKEELFDLGFKKGDLGSFKKNKAGLYVLEEKIIPCNSLTRNFAAFTANYFLTVGVAVLDTGGNSRVATNGNATGSTSKLLATYYGAGVTTGGIQLGTGTTATTINDIAIQTLIAHGTGAGQLSYAATVAGGWSTSGSDSWFNVSRTFTNNSGSAITNINEVTLVVRMNGTTTQHFLIERTVLPSSETINNAASKTFNYNFTVTV